MNSNETSAPNTNPAPAALDDYLKTVDLLTGYARRANRLAELQGRINDVLLVTADEMQTEYTLLQDEQGAAEGEMERIARAHPEWFEKKASLTMPAGVIKLTSTSELEVADEELSVALLEKNFPDTAALYLKITKTLRKEALEAMDDAELKTLKVRRVKSKSFKVTAAKVSLGDAVAKAKGDKK